MGKKRARRESECRGYRDTDEERRPTQTQRWREEEMAGRFFTNDFPDYVEEGSLAPSTADKLPLSGLLWLPHSTLKERLLRAALDIKDKVVKETWAKPRHRVNDCTLYKGALGTAFLLFKSYQVTGNRDDLELSARIVKACDDSSDGLPSLTFLCGRAGVCALGAAIASLQGDTQMLNYYMRSFDEVHYSQEVPNELLYGRAGYLWCCLFLRKFVSDNIIPQARLESVVKDIIKQGRNMSKKGSCPLMYEWHGKKYYGAAHGLAGIMHVLMDMDLQQDEKDDVKGTLLYLIQNRFPGGNYPSSEGNHSDRLVQWCHGASGVALTMAKAYQVFQDEHFLQVASESAEVVWNRGLLKKVGLCHGISGNIYTFLCLHRVTDNEKYLYRAKAFACFLLEKSDQLIAEGKMHAGDRPYSLFEGQAGLSYVFLDMVKPPEARFPAYEL